MQRAALYIRVSTDEQAQHGYSLEAQKEALTSYATKHDMYIVDYYVDDGYSARKKYTSRKEFMRMLSDVRQDKIDIILFIKLDRWFRSVKDYYKIQEILEAHNVGWKTTEENYDTTTTNGRLYINIRLSVAQDESDRTSDRIKFVFENKVARGEVISGAQPIGFKIENKHLVHDDEKKDIAYDIFNYYAAHQSRYATMRYINEKYGLYIEKSNMLRILRNPLYVGKYRGNNNYCEPLIDEQLFNKVQEIVNSRGIRRSRTGRVYIFSGLVRCSECGHAFTVNYNKNRENEYYYYRCETASNIKMCSNLVKMNEKHIEEWLLENIEPCIDAYIFDYSNKKVKSPTPAYDRAKVKRKMEKLKELFLNELISLDDYKADYEQYSAQLEVKPGEETDKTDSIAALREFLSVDFRSRYIVMDRLERQMFWRNIIKEIRVDSLRNITIIFT